MLVRRLENGMVVLCAKEEMNTEAVYDASVV